MNETLTKEDWRVTNKQKLLINNKIEPWISCTIHPLIKRKAYRTLIVFSYRMFRSRDEPLHVAGELNKSFS